MSKTPIASDLLEVGFLPFNITVNTYNASQQIPREDLCNAVIVTNLGNVTVTINGKTLFPSATPATDQGDSFTFGGGVGEIYSGKLQLTVATGGAPLVEVVQKFYVKINK